MNSSVKDIIHGAEGYKVGKNYQNILFKFCNFPDISLMQITKSYYHKEIVAKLLLGENVRSTKRMENIQEPCKTTLFSGALFYFIHLALERQLRCVSAYQKLS